MERYYKVIDESLEEKFRTLHHEFKNQVKVYHAESLNEMYYNLDEVRHGSRGIQILLQGNYKIQIDSVEKQPVVDIKGITHIIDTYKSSISKYPYIDLFPVTWLQNIQTQFDLYNKDDSALITNPQFIYMSFMDLPPTIVHSGKHIHPRKKRRKLNPLLTNPITN